MQVAPFLNECMSNTNSNSNSIIIIIIIIINSNNNNKRPRGLEALLELKTQYTRMREKF